jgi:hypothetical protein
MLLICRCCYLQLRKLLPASHTSFVSEAACFTVLRMSLWHGECRFDSYVKYAKLSLVWSTRDQSSASSLQEFVSKLFHFRPSSLFHTPADSEISVQCKDVVPSMLHSSSLEGSRERILKLLLVAVGLMSIAVDLVFLLSTYAPWLLLQQLWTRALTYSSSSQQAAAAAHRQGSTGARTRARVDSCIEYYRDQATLESASACRSVG